MFHREGGALVRRQAAQRVNPVTHHETKIPQFPPKTVLDRDLPIPALRHHRGSKRVVARLHPVAHEQLAGPHRNRDVCGKAFVPLEHVGPARILSSAVRSHELAPQSRLRLFADDFIAGVYGRIDGGISAPAPFRGLAVRQDVHQMEFVPFGFTGAELVADVIDQQGKQRDVNRERQPGEHLFVGALETVLIHRPNDEQVNDQQQQQPLHRQFAHLPAVDHGAENTVNAHAAVRVQIFRPKPTRRNLQQLRPEPLAVFPGTEWLTFGAEGQHGDLAPTAPGGNDERRSLRRKHGLAVA